MSLLGHLEECGRGLLDDRSRFDCRQVPAYLVEDESRVGLRLEPRLDDLSPDSDQAEHAAPVKPDLLRELVDCPVAVLGALSRDAGGDTAEEPRSSAHREPTAELLHDDVELG